MSDAVDGIWPRDLITAAFIVPRPVVSSPAGETPLARPVASCPAPLVSSPSPVSSCSRAAGELAEPAAQLAAGADCRLMPARELRVAGVELLEPAGQGRGTGRGLVSWGASTLIWDLTPAAMYAAAPASLSAPPRPD